MSSWSLNIILKHGLGDFAIKSDESPIQLPFNIEEACREIDAKHNCLRFGLSQIIDEGIDTSTDGGMRFVKELLEDAIQK